MYRLPGFGTMINDRVRMDAYVEGLRRTVTPESVVLDIGTGTGIFAMIACQFGARHVYAIEPNPLIEFGKQFAQVNGFADRITFIENFSTEIELPEKVDIIVGDLRGQLPFFDPNIATFHDAWQRFAKPTTVILPQRDHLYASYVSNAEQYRTLVTTPWQENPYNLDMSSALPMLTSMSTGKFPITAEAMLLPGQQWDTIEYGKRAEPNAKSRLEWTVEKAGTIHFLSLWFDSTMIGDIGYSGAPHAPNPLTVYGSMLYPLAKPIDLEPGQLVRLDLDLYNVSSGYETRWITSVFSNPSDTNQPLVKLDQSTFYAKPLNNLHRRTLNFTPTLNLNGQLQAFIFGEMNKGERTVEQIAKAALERFGSQGWSYSALLTQVSNVSHTFST